ncbi:MAG: dTDP-4-dehydrorhamnose 3,5-epimerase [Candidatus Aureabacteria bacterium]|nr:dTDP-4-dehydrorhamnose 3,5-epimerase [Candidatus Auribacterota bacterium]
MRFTETPLGGAYLIDLEKKEDDRGFFARAFCVEEFGRLGLETGIVQINNSLSARKGTLRGMHYQLPPMAETKIVRCIRGSFHDVIVDLRSGSPTFMEWFGVTLSADNRRALYVPKGFAHGILTLEDDTEAFYLVTQFYSRDHERGIRWNDPVFEIEWPMRPVVVSEKDASHPDFSPSHHLGAGA